MGAAAMVHPAGTQIHPSFSFETFKLPAGAKPYHRVLVRGPGVSVYCDRQGPNAWPEHRHEAVKLLITSEAAECRVTWWEHGGRRVRRALHGREVWIMPSGIRHAEHWLHEADMIVLYLSAGWLGQFEPGLITGVAVESVEAMTLCDPLIGGLTRELRSHCVIKGRQHPGQVMALGQCLAARLLHGLASRREGPPGVCRRLGQEAMRRVAAFVEDRLGERILLADLAREARLSPGHFGVLFKATMQLTPEQYILRMRLNRARLLIETGAYTVGQVAHRTGFADHSHLTVQFHRLFGAPPKAYLPRVRTV